MKEEKTPEFWPGEFWVNETTYPEPTVFFVFNTYTGADGKSRVVDVICNGVIQRECTRYALPGIFRRLA